MTKTMDIKVDCLTLYV